MAEARRFSWREIVLGVAVVLCAGGALAAGLKYAKASRFWRKRQDIYVVFENVGSLTQDAPVRYNGLEIGRVKELRPLHLDDKILAEKFRPLAPRDLDNLPIRGDDAKRRLSALKPEEFDKQCRAELNGATMILLCLEVLGESDRLRYRLDDDMRIVSTVFGDSAVEIVSGSGPIDDAAKPFFVIGNTGDFFSNVSKTMSEVKKILGNVSEIVSDDERRSFGKAQSRYAPVNEQMKSMQKSASERMAATLAHYNELTENANARLNETGKMLEKLQPSAELATKAVQDALKDIQLKTQTARTEANETMTELSKDFDTTRDSIKDPIAQLNAGLTDVRAEMLAVKTDVEKAPARLDAASDALGSMQSQSTTDMERFAAAAKKIVPNLKIAAYVAKENKDLMLANRDAGEYFAQSIIDTRRKLAMASRRITNAAADTLETLHGMEADPDASMMTDPVLERANAVVKRLWELRDPLDEVLNKMDAEMYVPWNLRKRAAWTGDGLVRGR